VQACRSHEGKFVFYVEGDPPLWTLDALGGVYDSSSCFGPQSAKSTNPWQEEILVD
jgi:hypothetical protein